jgi:hypothetical protein
VSTELHFGRLILTRYAGPAGQPGGRRRYQVTIPGEYFTVAESELPELLSELSAVLELLADEATEHAARKGEALAATEGTEA